MALIWIANHRIKVHMYVFVTYQNQTHILEWFVVRCGTKKQYQRYMWFQEIELRAQNMTTILLCSYSQHNWWVTYVTI